MDAIVDGECVTGELGYPECWLCLVRGGRSVAGMLPADREV